MRIRYNRALIQQPVEHPNFKQSANLLIWMKYTRKASSEKSQLSKKNKEVVVKILRVGLQQLL